MTKFWFSRSFYFVENWFDFSNNVGLEEQVLVMTLFDN